MRKFLIKNVFLPAADFTKGTKIYQYHRFCWETIKWERDQIVEFQLSKLKKLLVHSYQTVPFYKSRFDKIGFHPKDLKSIEDLKLIPPLTRRELQLNHNQLLSQYKSSGKLYRGTSSGSTGEPVIYFHDVNARSSGGAILYFAWQLAGWHFGMKGLHIWGNPRTVNVEWERKSSQLKSILFNIQRFPSYQLTDEKMFDKLINLVVKEDFNYIDGYTNAIYLLAKKIKDRNIKIKKLSCILPTGETLFDYQRSIINEVLGPVSDFYGCGEVMGIAFQTKFSNYYQIFDPHVIVEYDKSFKTDDNAYPLITTDLDNYAYPFIRYKNGDMAEPSDETNNLPFKMLKRISGRTSDIIELPGGGNLSVPSFFGSKLLRLIQGIKQYQIEKITSDKIIIYLVRDNKFSESEKTLINKSIEEYLSGRINCEIKLVERIDYPKTGKFKLVIDKTKNQN